MHSEGSVSSVQDTELDSSVYHSSEQAVQYDDFDMQFQPRDPPCFSGKSTEDPEFWAGQISNFFRLVGGSHQKQVAFASTLLLGPAQHWWQRMVKTRRMPTDWPALQHS